MFFRRPRPKIPSFRERVDLLKNAGCSAQDLPDRRVRITKNGIGAIVGDEGKNQPAIEKAGVLIGSDIAKLRFAGYQMFLEMSDGKLIPARAEELKALHEFEEDVKYVLGLVDLYNTSLGTTTNEHMYDRVYKRDSGQQPKPWERKEHRIVPPDTKDTSANTQ
jgi:hypothetical protein